MSENRPSALMEHIERLRHELESDEAYKYLYGRGVWFNVCSALDILDDTELAVYAYNPALLADKNGFLGGKYLMIYGVMQAAQLKIDAVKTLVKHLGGPDFARVTAVKEMAVARNLLAGHPIRQTENGKKTSSFLSQAELEYGRLRVTRMPAQQADQLFDVDKFEVESLIRNLDDAAVQCMSEIEVIPAHLAN
jgi:hypothetical protein